MMEPTLPDPEPVPPPVPGHRLATLRPGRYVEFERVGKGGMGVVYLALDTDLNRRVAMKVVRPEMDPSTPLPDSPHALEPPHSGSPVSDAFEELEARFLREATVTGGMEHPGIVPVYELGATEAGVPYYTMRYVRGNRTLRAALVGRPSFSRRLVMLEPWLKVVDTLAYAHDRGVIHRDLKPANIALGEYGEVIVLDWGLAKVKGTVDEAAQAWQTQALDDRAEHETVAGAIGTPGFMSPEAARGELARVDHRTDVYSLGVMLFEILTGRLPSDLTNLATYMTSLLKHDAPRADEIDPDVPTALADICALALAREPEDRIQSAIELAARVRFWEQSTQLEREVAQRFVQAEAALDAADGLTGLGVVAPLDRAVSALTRAREVMPEDPRVPALEQRINDVRRRSLGERDRESRLRLLRRVGLLALVGVALAAFIVIGLIDAERREAVRQRVRADNAATEAGRANRASTRSLATSYTVAARRFIQEKRGAAAALAAARAMELHATTEAGLALGSALSILPPRSIPLSVGMSARSLAFDSTGTHLAAGGEYGLVRVWDIRTGRAVREIPGRGGTSLCLAYLEDDRHLVAGARDGTLRVFDLDAGQASRPLVGPKDALVSVVGLPGDGGVAAVTRGGRLLLWSLPGGVLEPPLALDRGPLADVCRGVAGTLWIRSEGGALLQVGPTNQDPIPVRVVREAGVLHLAARRLDASLWIAGPGLHVEQLDAATGVPRKTWELSARAPDAGAIRALVGSAGATAAILDDGAAVLFRVGGRAPELLGGAGPDTRVAALAPDGHALATSDAEHRIRLWAGGRNAPIAIQAGHSMSVTGIAARGGVGGIVTAAQDGTLIVWSGDPPEPTSPIRVDGPGLGVRCLAVSPDGERAFCVSMSPGSPARTQLHAVDLARKRIAWSREIHAVVLTNGLLACSDRAVYTPRANGQIGVYSAGSGELERSLGAGAEGGLGATNALALSADGSRLVRAFFRSADQTYGLRVIDVASGREVELPGTTKAMATCVAISRDGRLGAMGTTEGTTGVWHLDPAERPRWIESDDDRIFAVAFSPDGRRVLTGGAGIRVYDVERGLLRERWDGHAGSVSALAFDAPGTRLYSASFDGTVRLWRLTARGPITRLVAPAPCTALLRDVSGKRLFVGLANATIEERDPTDGSVRRTLRLPFDPPPLAFERGVVKLALSRGGARLAVADARGRVHVFDLADGRLLGAPRLINRPVTGLGLSDDGLWVFVASSLVVSDQMPPAFVTAERTRPIQIFDVTGPSEPIETLGGHGSRPTSLTVIDAGRLAYGVEDGRVYVRTPLDPTRIEILQAHTRAVTALFAARAQGRLFSADDGDTIFAWDTATNRRVGRFGGRGPLAGSRDGAWLARVEGVDPLELDTRLFVRVWAPRSGESGFLIPGHARGVGDLALSPEGDRLWTIGPFGPGQTDDEIHVVDLSWWRRPPAERARQLARHTGLRLVDLSPTPAPASHFTPLVEDVFRR